jgi:colanic acid/amylovoran biosynthesis glycosyltransferase
MPLASLLSGWYDRRRSSMRIAFVVGAFPKLSETFVLEQILKLLARGHDVSIFAFEAPAEPVRHAAIDQQHLLERTTYLTRAPTSLVGSLSAVLRTPGLGIVALRDPDALGRLQAHGKQGNFDVIYCHFGHVAERARRLRRVGLFAGPLVAVFHALDVTVLVDGAHTYRKLFEEADRLLPISAHWSRRLLELGAPAAKIDVRHMGIDCGAFEYRPRSLVPGQLARVVSIGRLVEKKGFSYGIRAVASAEKALGQPLDYHLIGDGPLRAELEALARAEGLADRVTFHGSKRSDEVVALLSNAHILMAPSVTASNGDMEGIPMVLMEAMAQGMPVVSTFHSGIPELVQNGRSGVLVPERDVPALASALAALVRTPEVWPSLQSHARQTVEAEFDSERLTLGLEQLFGEIQRTARTG